VERQVAAQRLRTGDARPQLLQMVEVTAELGQTLGDRAHA